MRNYLVWFTIRYRRTPGRAQSVGAADVLCQGISNLMGSAEGLRVSLRGRCQADRTKVRLCLF
jgi:hypothetical protein